jgi:hypothetical protein
MSCAQRLLHNGLNHARTATLIASSVLPVDNTVRSLPALRSGSASVALAGSYSGAADATFDIEVIDTTPTTPILSRPLLSGVGNGTLTALSFTGAAQSFTLELVDAGLPTLSAAVAFAGCQIVARVPGAAGNGITITVDSSGITYTPLPFSLIAPLPKDTRRSDAVGLDFNAAVMAADNQFPASAKRIAFGIGKTQVYRQAKQWTGAKWDYIFEPQLAAYQPAGTRISEVTGTYSVTVAQGATTQTFTGITSNYDLLIALNTLSTLVKVDGVIANDRAADGQNASDLTMRTDAYAQPVQGSGSTTAQNATLQNVVISAGAPTEIIQLECWATTARNSPNAHLGAELWTARGSVVGPLGNFKTGDTISPPGGEWSLAIPAVYPEGYGDARGEISVSSIEMMPRTLPEVAPAICMVSLALGPDAIDQTVRLVYTKRAALECPCDDLPVPDLSNNACLIGDTPNSTGATSVSFPPTIQVRMDYLWKWRADVAESYSADRYTDTTEATGEKARNDAATIIATLLKKTAVAVAANPTALALWDTLFADVQAQYIDASLTPTVPASYVAQEAIAANSFVIADYDGKVYRASWRLAALFLYAKAGYVTSAFAAGATIPFASMQVGSSLSGLSGLTTGEIYTFDDVSPGGLEPLGGTNPVITGVALSATALLLNSPRWLTVNSFYLWAAFPGFRVIIERFQTRCDAILASAGIDPTGKSDASAVDDDGCWQDYPGEAHYWAIVGSGRGAYLPAFTNTPYFSSRTVAGHNAATHEYAFQINVGCPEKLLVGDTINLVIGNAGWAATYQVGDLLALPVIAAAPQTLAGGQTGNADQKWNVNGSVVGALAPFTALGGSGAYTSGGLAFTLTQGGIKFDKGDRFAFSAEGGHWRWRKNGGAWSGALDITAAPVALSDGLANTFAPGVAPSFTAADKYSFAVRQPNAPGNAQTPSPFAWRWTGASATLDVDMGSAQAFDAITLARHQLPLTATVVLTAGTTQGASDVLAATPLTLHTGTLAKLWDAPLTARWVRISLTGAAGGAIGWVTIAQAFRTKLAAKVTVRRDYVMDRGNGINPAARNLGKGKSGNINWDDLLEADAAGIEAAIDWVKSHDDEPFQFFAAPTRETESLLAQIDGDSVEFIDAAFGQAALGNDHRQSISIGLKGIMQ